MTEVRLSATFQTRVEGGSGELEAFTESTREYRQVVRHMSLDAGELVEADAELAES